MDSIPPLSVDLIEQLNKMYPAMGSRDLLGRDLLEIRMRAAQRVIIDRLLSLQKSTYDEDLLGG